MAIRLVCPSCNRGLSGPDTMAGKSVRCPGCKQVFTAPDNVVDAEAVGQEEVPEAPSASVTDRRRKEPPPDGEEERPRRRIRSREDQEDDREDYRVEEDEDRPRRRSREEEEEGTKRRPCPMCGEMIATRAAKCRYCGEIFDPELRRLEKRKARRERGRGSSDNDDDMTPIDWVLAVLCSGIGCIVGIVYLSQGKPKGGKMLGVSLAFAVLWNIINMAIRASMKH